MAQTLTSVLVTGGAGYIGSHVCVELLQAGYQVLVLDNLCNSSQIALDRVEQIAGKPLTFIRGDIGDRQLLDRLFRDHPVDAIMHFAGLKAVGESVAQPLRYYMNNVTGTLTLLQAAAAAGCLRFVFSSSATVYGDPASNPIDESFPLSATNPYGRSKLMCEDLLRDLYTADSRWNISLLRYFNPVGAHPSGMIGESPNDIPNNLLPYIAQVATGQRERLAVFGDDYPTPDGTGVRDYIHVVDLARGHLKALQTLAGNPGLLTHNLGTGTGYSVLEMLAAFEQACGRPLAHEVVARRAGDVAECYANPNRAKAELGWRAELDLEAMCTDAWRWQSNNPEGYTSG